MCSGIRIIAYQKHVQTQYGDREAVIVETDALATGVQE